MSFIKCATLMAPSTLKAVESEAAVGAAGVPVGAATDAVFGKGAFMACNKGEKENKLV
jgi:hypothetical protein